jgi:g-D-glutamyl-meso-diaminopimelate peptidase
MIRCLWFILLFCFVMEDQAEAKIVQTEKPYTYEVLKADLHRLQGTYGEILQVKKMGKTPFGRNIYAVHLGTGKKNVLLIGAHHGREWLTSMLLMNMLESYAAAYEKHQAIGPYSANILNDVSIWFVPMLNPDGVSIQQNQIQSFPMDHQKQLLAMNEGMKDFIRWKANGMGVDLNRQYPAGWNEIPYKPEAPSFQFYKGKIPLQEVEVASLVQFVQKIKPRAALSYHTAGREIFWRYKNGVHLFRDRMLAKQVEKLTGYKLAKPPKEATGGGFTDWFITTWHRPAMTIEISYLVGDRHPPLAVFNEEWNRNKYIGIMIAKKAKSIMY